MADAPENDPQLHNVLRTSVNVESTKLDCSVKCETNEKVVPPVRSISCTNTDVVSEKDVCTPITAVVSEVEHNVCTPELVYCAVPDALDKKEFDPEPTCDPLADVDPLSTAVDPAPVEGEARVDSPAATKEICAANESYLCTKCWVTFGDAKSWSAHSRDNCGAHRCDKCRKTFASRSHLDDHAPACGAVNSRTFHELYGCSSCRKVFNAARQRDEHFRTPCSRFVSPPAENPVCAESGRARKVQHRDVYRCDDCNYAFVSKSFLDAHLAVCGTRGTMKQAPVCVRCCKLFPTYVERSAHVCTCRPVFRCTHCDIRFPGKLTLRKHMATHHSTDISTNGKTLGDESFQKKRSKKLSVTKNSPVRVYSRSVPLIKKNSRMPFHSKLYGCPSCDGKFPSASKLEKHASECVAKDGASASVCAECGEELLPQTRLRKAPHVCATFQCTICEVEFTVRDAFTRHVREHFEHCEETVARPAEVELCEESVSIPCEVEYLESAPRKAYVFKCADCGEEYSLRAELTAHVCIHLKCTICDATLPDKDGFSEHVRAHFEQQYHCLVCSRAFDRPEQRDEHFKTECGKFVYPSKAKQVPPASAVRPAISFRCTSCRRTCPTLEELAEHEAMHNVKFPHICSVCDETIKSMYYFEKHIKRYDGYVKKKDTIPMCPHCKECFATACLSFEHVRNRCPKSRHFICAHCSIKETTKKCLVVHMKSHDPTKIFKCSLCKDAFSKKNSMHLHIKRCHMSTCTMCDKVFSCKRNLEMHVKRVHETAVSKGPDDGKSGAKLVVDRVKFLCDTCGKGFPGMSYLKKHLASHGGKAFLKCPSCPRLFAKALTLQRHAVAHEQGLSCHLCPKMFARKTDLIKHVHHHSRPLLSCASCGEAFLSVPLINRHTRHKHKGGEFYECDTCGQLFTVKDALISHVELRNCVKRRRFPCKLCDFVGLSATNLQHHKESHMGFRHSCEVCGKAFTSGSHFRRHKLLHSDVMPFRCGPCDKQYAQAGNYTYHMKAIHGNSEPFACDKCEASFSLPSLLKEHGHLCEKMVHQTTEDDDGRLASQSCSPLMLTDDVLPVSSELSENGLAGVRDGRLS